MWLASWPMASTVAGKPTGSTNPLIDDHIISALAIIVVGAYAAHSAGYLGRWWSNQAVVGASPGCAEHHGHRERPCRHRRRALVAAAVTVLVTTVWQHEQGALLRPDNVHDTGELPAGAR